MIQHLQHLSSLSFASYRASDKNMGREERVAWGWGHIYFYSPVNVLTRIRGVGCNPSINSSKISVSLQKNSDSAFLGLLTSLCQMLSNMLLSKRLLKLSLNFSPVLKRQRVLGNISDISWQEINVRPSWHHCCHHCYFQDQLCQPVSGPGAGSGVRSHMATDCMQHLNLKSFKRLPALYLDFLAGEAGGLLMLSWLSKISWPKKLKASAWRRGD